MRILGLIGRLNSPGCHDGAAAIIEDGRVIAALEQERVSRRRHAPGEAAFDAVRTCLAEARLRLSDIDHIAYGWLEPLAQPERCLGHDIVASRELTPLLLPPEMLSAPEYPPIWFVKHHLAHFAASYFTSGFRAAAGLVIDGQGEHESISMYQACSDDVKLLHSHGLEASLGLFYEAAAYFCGLGWDAAGKLMGLSSFGRPDYDIGLSFDAAAGQVCLPALMHNRFVGRGVDAPTVCQCWLDYFEQSFYPYKSGNRLEVMYYADFAASVQNALETVACALVSWLRKRTGFHALVLSGGVALNCAMNHAIAQAGQFPQYYIFPAAHDAGASIGAALALYYRLRPDDYPRSSQQTVALGRTYTDAECEAAFREQGLLPLRLDLSQLVEQVADDLASDRVVGWFQYRDEFGPRALGQRSLLASPTNRNNLSRLNRIKGRDIWRPIAPSLLAEHAMAVCEDLPSTLLPRFMLTVSRVRGTWRSQVPAIVHIDGTTRPHIVDQREEHLLWTLLEAFRSRTGIPLVCNTSFNLEGEPLVHSPGDALAAYAKREEIDTLVINQYYLRRSTS